MASDIMTSIKVPWGALLVGIVGVRLLLPWLPMEWLIANTLSDDAFYYFQVARNAAAGRGVTFDGEHPTNGFHPLWMGMSIAVYALTPNQPTLPIHTLLFVSTLFDLAAAFLIFLTVSRFSGNRLLCWGAPLLYALNPYLIQASLSGLETSLALFLFLLLIAVLLHLPARPAGKSTGGWLTGLVGGLLTLARLDYGIFFLAALAYLAWQERRLAPVLTASGIAAVLLLPWLLWSMGNFGTPVPISASAHTLVSRELFFSQPRTVAETIHWSVRQGWEAVRLTFRQTGAGLLAAAGAFAIGGAMVYLRLKNAPLAQVSFRAPLVLLMLFLAAFGVLVFIHGVIRWAPRPWYFLEFAPLAIVGTALLLENFSRIRPWTNRTILSLLGFLIAISYAGSAAALWEGKTRHRGHTNQLDLLAAAMFIRDHLPPEVRITSFNSGIIGYFSGRSVVHAAGLANASAFEAMRKHALWSYFIENRITHIADYESALTYRYQPVLGIGNPLEYLRVVTTISPDAVHPGATLRIYALAPL